MDNKRIFTSIMVSDPDLYKGLTIEENTQFIKFIKEALDTNPSWFTPRKKGKTKLNVQIRQSEKNVYMDVLKLLKKNNWTFTAIYTQLYSSFVASNKNTKKEN